MRGRTMFTGGCTMTYCRDACCNRCGGVLGLVEKNGPRDPTKPIALRHLRCHGDDSAVCCPLPEGQEVITTGILERVDLKRPEYGELGLQLALSRVEVCRVP